MQSIAETCVCFDAAHLSINLVSEIAVPMFTTLIDIRNFLNIQALMCVALMSILYSVGTTIRSLIGLETYPQASKFSKLVRACNQGFLAV